MLFLFVCLFVFLDSPCRVFLLILKDEQSARLALVGWLLDNCINQPLHHSMNKMQRSTLKALSM